MSIVWNSAIVAIVFLDNNVTMAVIVYCDKISAMTAIVFVG